MMASRKQPIFTLAAIFLTVAVVGANCANAQAIRGLQIEYYNQGAAVNQNVTGPLADLIRANNGIASGTVILPGTVLRPSGNETSLLAIALNSPNGQQVGQVSIGTRAEVELINGLVALVRNATNYIVQRANVQVNVNATSETVDGVSSVISARIVERLLQLVGASAMM